MKNRYGLFRFGVAWTLIGCCPFVLWISGCRVLNSTAPVSSSALNSSSPAATPQPVCFLFSRVNIPLSPSGSGNYVIRGTSDWEAYNNCASLQSCPVPPVNFQKQMVLTTETLLAHSCSCTPLSEAVSSVCSDGTQITVHVVQTLPSGCTADAFATPQVCNLAPVTLQASVAVSTSNLPVVWDFTQISQ